MILSTGAVSMNCADNKLACLMGALQACSRYTTFNIQVLNTDSMRKPIRPLGQGQFDALIHYQCTGAGD
jgi:hypothetical protein